jgi:hypothetical protein
MTMLQELHQIRQTIDSLIAKAEAEAQRPATAPAICKPQSHRSTPKLRAPTDKDYADRTELFARYHQAACQIGREPDDDDDDGNRAGRRGVSSLGTQARLASRKNLSPSELSRWFPPKHNPNRRPILVGSQTDITIRRALVEEIDRIESRLNAMTHGNR